MEYERPELGERCHFYLLKLYLTKLPPIAVEKDIFHWKAKSKVPFLPYEPWFTTNVLGHNTLDKLLKKMLQDA